eukprot:CAMPEP_0117077260 /NCGR_PEP_ID=MMETSP0472-20121206/54471_1 /TAXON_ID=693140 ORGANISM="Tiarina fusus, Strain LIS" /NCGR_SAMPLE_ID=MMETSP0472 /ASSEMBLY_ACC=CAM_ASM_000603 /LENGTH=141 /DNA_ID=CAMNT_0004803513 /DNA_START=230 /DNA_END=655 /DNA_ORIENTATION=-
MALKSRKKKKSTMIQATLSFQKGDGLVEPSPGQIKRQWVVCVKGGESADTQPVMEMKKFEVKREQMSHRSTHQAFNAPPARQAVSPQRNVPVPQRGGPRTSVAGRGRGGPRASVRGGPPQRGGRGRGGPPPRARGRGRGSY